MALDALPRVAKQATYGQPWRDGLLSRLAADLDLPNDTEPPVNAHPYPPQLYETTRRQHPPRVYTHIVLRYGVTNNGYLLDWRNRILQDDFSDRRNGSIILRTLQMEEVRRYNFVQAWPVGWDGPNFDAGAADLAIESIEIAHHGITVS